jgi:hypothetical protein
MIGFGKKKTIATALPWARTADGKFFRLMTVNPVELALTGQPGVYVIWYASLQTGWVYVGGTADLGAAIPKAQESSEINAFAERGPLGITWVSIVDKYRDRVVVYLRNTLKPLAGVELDTINMEAEPLTVAPPYSPAEKELF